jgi:hypothetical protein
MTTIWISSDALTKSFNALKKSFKKLAGLGEAGARRVLHQTAMEMVDESTGRDPAH